MNNLSILISTAIVLTQLGVCVSLKCYDCQWWAASGASDQHEPACYAASDLQQQSALLQECASGEDLCLTRKYISNTNSVVLLFRGCASTCEAFSPYLAECCTEDGCVPESSVIATSADQADDVTAPAIVVEDPETTPTLVDAPITPPSLTTPTEAPVETPPAITPPEVPATPSIAPAVTDTPPTTVPAEVPATPSVAPAVTDTPPTTVPAEVPSTPTVAPAVTDNPTPTDPVIEVTPSVADGPIADTTPLVTPQEVQTSTAQDSAGIIHTTQGTPGDPSPTTSLITPSAVPGNAIEPLNPAVTETPPRDVTPVESGPDVTPTTNDTPADIAPRVTPTAVVETSLMLSDPTQTSPNGITPDLTPSNDPASTPAQFHTSTIDVDSVSYVTYLAPASSSVTPTTALVDDSLTTSNPAPADDTPTDSNITPTPTVPTSSTVTPTTVEGTTPTNPPDTTPNAGLTPETTPTSPGADDSVTSLVSEGPVFTTPSTVHADDVTSPLIAATTPTAEYLECYQCQWWLAPTPADTVSSTDCRDDMAVEADATLRQRCPTSYDRCQIQVSYLGTGEVSGFVRLCTTQQDCDSEPTSWGDTCCEDHRCNGDSSDVTEAEASTSHAPRTPVTSSALAILTLAIICRFSFL